MSAPKDISWDKIVSGIEELDLKDYAMDFIDTYENDEIAQMVRENILTIEEVEAGLRRRMDE